MIVTCVISLRVAIISFDVLNNIMMLYIFVRTLEKNSCPLCQAEGIAEEIRSYDIETSESHVDAINVRATDN